jgi:hypothetical protein
MLPGLGGAQPIPPIYYNNATFAPAGAGIGKGVTVNSAPTFVAGAIPTLPMRKGGVVRYADGGAVSDEEMQSAATDVGDDYGEGAAGSTEQQYAMDYRPNADVVAGGRSGAEPSPGGGMDVGGAAPPTQQGPPPGAPAWTPQVNDGLGNPSRGLIGAIAGGLHYIGSMTGLGGQQGALAADPGVQTARQNFATGRQLNGQPLMTKDEYLHDVPEAIGADGLHEGLKHLASMEAIHKFYQYRGEAEKADQMSAMMMQVSVGLASEYGKEAVARYYNGDLKGAVEAMNRSKDVIADGTIVKATVNPDGKTVSVAGQNLNGEDLWRQVVAPQAILGAALHTANGSLPWHMYEISAAKYDQRSHDMIAARGQSAQSDQVNEAIGRMGPEFGEPIAPAGAQVTPASNAPPAPQPAQPRPPTTEAQAPAPAIPTLPNTSPIQDVAGVTPAARGGASGAQGTDRNAPATPPIGADTAGGTQPALPGPGPTRAAAAALPSPDAQEVAALTPEAEQAHYQQIVATTKPKYFTDDDRPIIGNRPMNRPEVMDQAVLAKALPEVKAAYKERWDRYTNAVQQNKALMSSDIDGQRRDYSLGINTQRTAQAQREADARAELGRQATDRRAELGRQATDARAAKAEDDRLALSQQAPLSPEKLTMFSRTPQPDSGMTEGSLPVDWYAASPHYATDANGTAMDAKTAKQRMMGDLDTKNAQGKIGGGVGRINLLDNALRTTQAYNQHVGTEELADLVLGGALDKYDYAASPTPVSLKHDAQGKPIPDGFDERYAVRFTRKDDGSGRTIVMTADDYNNMHGITMAMRAKNNAPPIQPPPMAIPTGPGQTNANDLMLPGIQ